MRSGRLTNLMVLVTVVFGIAVAVSATDMRQSMPKLMRPHGKVCAGGKTLSFGYLWNA